jgi:hypothetical protein
MLLGVLINYNMELRVVKLLFAFFLIHACNIG